MFQLQCLPGRRLQKFRPNVLHPSASALMMETVCPTETFATADQTVRYCMLKDDNVTSLGWLRKEINFLLQPLQRLYQAIRLTKLSEKLPTVHGVFRMLIFLATFETCTVIRIFEAAAAVRPPKCGL